MPEIWTTNGGKDGWFFVGEKDPNDPGGEPVGHGISLGEGEPGRLKAPQPLSSYMNRNPYEQWAEYTGDPTPILAALAQARRD